MPKQSTDTNEMTPAIINEITAMLDELFPDNDPISLATPEIQYLRAHDRIHEGTVGAPGEFESTITATSNKQTEKYAVQVYKQEDYDVFIGVPGELALAKIIGFDSVLVDGRYLSFWACDRVIILVDDSTVKIVHKTKQEEHVFVVAASKAIGNWQSTSVNRFEIKEGR